MSLDINENGKIETENDDKKIYSISPTNIDQFEKDIESFLDTIGLGKWQISTILINILS